MFGTYSRIWAKQFNIDPLGYKVNLTRQCHVHPHPRHRLGHRRL